MNEQRPLARVILTTVDMLRAARDEIARLDKAGHSLPRFFRATSAEAPKTAEFPRVFADLRRVLHGLANSLSVA